MNSFLITDVDHLLGVPILAKAIAGQDFIKEAGDDLIIVSPDVGRNYNEIVSARREDP